MSPPVNPGTLEPAKFTVFQYINGKLHWFSSHVHWGQAMQSLMDCKDAEIRSVPDARVLARIRDDRVTES
jgi:hypothetical protein